MIKIQGNKKRFYHLEMDCLNSLKSNLYGRTCLEAPLSKLFDKVISGFH